MYYKKLICAFLVVTSLVACTSKNNMKLTGSVDGLKKGTLILQKIKDSTLTSIDSLVIDGDAFFEFNETVDSPQLYFLYLRLKDGTLLDERIPFFAEAGELSIDTSLKNFTMDAVITGSTSHTVYEAYGNILKRFNEQNVDYIAAEFEGRKRGEDSFAKTMELKRERVIKRKYLASINFAINNKDSEVAPFIATTAIEDANKKYLDTIYSSLTPRVKASYYGKKLASLLSEK